MAKFFCCENSNPFPTVLPEVMADRDLYQYIAGQPSVSISFSTSERENPRLSGNDVTVWFRNTDGMVSEVVKSDYRTVTLDPPEGGVVNRITVSFTPVRIQDNGTYWVTATNEAGTTNSTPARVEVFGKEREICEKCSSVRDGVLQCFLCCLSLPHFSLFPPLFLFPPRSIDHSQPNYNGGRRVGARP